MWGDYGNRGIAGSELTAQTEVRRYLVTITEAWINNKGAWSGRRNGRGALAPDPLPQLLRLTLR